MNISNHYTAKCIEIEDVALRSESRSSTRFPKALNKQTWFVGLYLSSLFCLTVTGASVRWILTCL